MKKINHCTFSPDRIFGIYIGGACELHDFHYRLKQKFKSRKDTDKEFLNDLKLIGLNKWYNSWIAYIYYLAVRLLMKPAWERWKYKWYLGFVPIRKELINNLKFKK